MKTSGNLFSIVRKELKGYFDSPTAYIVLVIFLFAWQFLFFKNAFIIGEASLRPLFESLPWFFLILIPALTMGSVSQEKNEGTLEWILTHPVREWELLVGKFLASLVFVLVALLFSLPIALSFSLYGDFDWGIFAAQFFASLLMGGLFLALGIFLSSLLKSQVTALLASALVIFFLIIIQTDMVSNSLPVFVGNMLERLSASAHFNSMARGVIDLRDVLYFLTAAASLLGLAYLQLLKPKYGNRKSLYRSWQLGVTMLIGIAALINVIGDRIPGRLDLTANNLYTLSPTTEKLLGGLDDIVRITLYGSDDLPAVFAPIERDVKDLLRDFEVLGKGKVIVTRKNPAKNPDIEKEATSLGIIKGQLNVIRQEEFQVKSGFFGLDVASGGKHEVIPFVQKTDDLEYQLVSFVTKLTKDEASKKSIVFLSGHGEKSPDTDYTILGEELEKQFSVKTFSLTEAAPPAEEGQTPTPAKELELPEDTAVLVIAGPSTALTDSEKQKISAYLENGGRAFFLIDKNTANPEMMSAMPTQENASDILTDFGVTVNQDIAFDLASNLLLTFRDGMFSYQQPYGFFVRAIPSATPTQLTSVIPGLALPWTSSLQIDEEKLTAKNWEVETHFLTSNVAGVQKDSFSIDPQQNLIPEVDKSFPLVVSLSKNAQEEGKGGRIVVVGDSDFLTDQTYQMIQIPENIAFGIEAVSWLAQEDSLAAIKLKDRHAARLLIENDEKKTAIKFGNLALAFLLPFVIGVARLSRRRRLRKFTFSGIA